MFRKLFVGMTVSLFVFASGCGDVKVIDEPGALRVIGEKEYEVKSIEDDVEISEDGELTAFEMRKIIEMGVYWLKEMQESSGHFMYEYNPFFDRYTDDDNMVRQAGTFYEMAEIYLQDQNGSMELDEYLERSISYFEENSVEGEANGRSFLCLKKSEYKCTLGGTSLALIGIIDYVKANPAVLKSYEGLINGYSEYLLAMKKEGGGFKNSYYFDGQDSDSESAFGNGEAFLALVRYHQYNEDEEVRQVVKQMAEYILEEYGEEYDNNIYIWAMAAFKDLQEMLPNEEYVDFARDFTDYRVEDYKGRRGTDHNRCGYLEGLTMAYQIFDETLSEEQEVYYLEEINFWLSKMAQFQVREGSVLDLGYKDYDRDEIEVVNMSVAMGGFLTDFDEPYQRIDFTQHCLSAYLQKYSFIDGEEL